MNWGSDNELRNTAPAKPKSPIDWKASLRTLRIIREVIRLFGTDYRKLLACHILSGLAKVVVFAGIFLAALSLSGAARPEFRLLLLACLSSWACLYFEPAFQYRTLSLNLRSRIRRLALHVVHSLPLESLEPMSRGDWLNRVVQDLFKIETFVIKKLPRQLSFLALGLATVIIGGVGLRGWIAVFVMVSSLIFLLGWLLEKRLRGEQRRNESVDEDLEDVWLESLEGIRTVHVQQAEAYFQRRYDDGVLGQRRTLSFFSLEVIIEMVEPLLTLTALALVLTLAWYEVILGDSQWFVLFILPVAKSAWEGGRAMCEWAEIQSELGVFAERLRPDFAGSHWGSRLDPEAIAKADHLSLRETFWETSEDWAGPLNWTVRRGELWVVTGRSDSGKSALLEVLAGLRTLSAGEVSSGFAEVSAGERVPIGLCGYVEQFPFIFKGTLRDNLTFGVERRVSDVTLWTALERVGLAAWVRELGGLDTVFQAHGKELLKAEKYRIALARVLLLDRPFLLLDEPFIHFDDKTISLLSRLLEEEKRTKAIVVVSRFLPKEIAVDGVISVTDFETKRTNSWGAVTRLSEAHP